MGLYFYPDKLKIETRTHKAPGSFKMQKALASEDPRWLQVENIVDPESGDTVPTVTIDNALKTLVQNDNFSKDQTKEAEKLAKEAAKDAVLDKVTALNVALVSDLVSIKAYMQDIKDIFLFLYDNDIKEKDKKDKGK